MEKYPQNFGQASCLTLGSFVSKDGALVGVPYHTELNSGERSFLFLVGEDRVWMPFCVTIQPDATALHQSCIVGNEVQSFLILPEIIERTQRNLS